MDKAILLLESEENRQRRIVDIINDTLEHVVIYKAKTLAEAYRILVERTMDIFIVNVVLECENATDTAGIRFVARIREIPKYTLAPVIIISSIADSSMYAYEELNCLGYLSKTFSTEKMKKLLCKASHFETSRNLEGTLFFRKNRVLYPIAIKDIVFMERANNITYIHLEDNTIMDIPYVTFKDIMYDADSSSLIMCNRSTIVNKNYVYAVDATNRFIVLKENRGMLDIGVKHRKSVLLAFSDHGSIQIMKTRKKKNNHENNCDSGK